MGESGEERHAVAVAGVIPDRDGRVLLMRRRDHENWEPPGGVLKVGESISAGLRREIEEETGVRVDVRRLTGVYENPRHGVLSLVFLCRPSGGSEAETREASDVRWVPLSEARMVLSRDYLDWVDDAFRAGAVAIRMQRDTVKGASSSPLSEL